MNQTYFEWYEFDGNVACILIAACTYKSMLQLNFNIVDSLIFKIACAPMSSEKKTDLVCILVSIKWLISSKNYFLRIYWHALASRPTLHKKGVYYWPLQIL